MPTARASYAVDHVGLQDTVVAALGVLGWQHLHVRRSIGKGRKWVTSTSRVGWPDLFCWHPAHRRLLAIELKVPPDRLTAEQADVLGELHRSGTEVAVLTPDDLARLGELLDPRGPALTGASVRPGLLPKGRDWL